METQSEMKDGRWKVLIVTEATSAGVGRHVADVVLNLDLNRFDVTLAYSSARSDQKFRDDVESMRAKGIRTVLVPMVREVSAKHDGRALLQLVKLIAKERFDLVYGESSKAGFLTRLATRLAGSSAVTVYTPNSIALSVNSVYWYPEKIAGFCTDAIIAVTQSERKQLTGYNLVPEAKIRTVIAGIEIPDELTAEETATIRREFGVPENAVLIGTAGRIAPQKDPLTFVRAAERVVQAGLPAYFLWLGDGEQRLEVETELRTRGLNQAVNFAGYCRDAPRVLGACDIFVLTSVYESFGYVTCEAMAYGKPVVASRVTGTSELVDPGVTGTLIEPGDDQGFAQALGEMIRDEHKREQMGAAGRLRAEAHFGLPRMIADTESLFEELLNSKSPRTSGGRVMSRPVVTG